MHDPACPFCRIVSGQEEVSLLYQDDLVTSFLDIFPATPGHSLVVPNQHVSGVAQLENGQYSRMFAVGSSLARALREAGLRCEGVNLYLADGRAAGQTVFHSHLHVIPRFLGDSCGLRLHAGPVQQPARSELDATAEQIRRSLVGPVQSAPRQDG